MDFQALKIQTLILDNTIQCLGHWRFINYDAELLTPGWRSLDILLRDRYDIRFDAKTLLSMHILYCKFKNITPHLYANKALSPEEIYQVHYQYLKDGNMPVSPKKHKRFNNKQEIAEFLWSGGILPELWKAVALKTQSNFQLIGLYSLLSFESPAAEAKFKKSFIATVELFLKY